MASIHLSVEANLLTTFIGAKTPRLSKINTYFEEKVFGQGLSKRRRMKVNPFNSSYSQRILTSSELSYNHDVNPLSNLFLQS